MERKRKLEVYEAPAMPAGVPPADGVGPSGAPEEPSVNPYNGRPYSQRYYQILAGRKGEQTQGRMTVYAAAVAGVLAASGAPPPLQLELRCCSRGTRSRLAEHSAVLIWVQAFLSGKPSRILSTCCTSIRQSF